MPETDARGPHRATPSGRQALLLAALCLGVSGAGSLVLEVTWTRLLRLVFGSTTLAVSTVLVAYMAGLGAGGLVGGRLADRLRNGIRVYGWLEIGIGLYALLVPPVLDLLPVLGREWWYALSFWPAALARFVLCLAVLALPTFLMGMTLPVLVAAVARDPSRSGRGVGLLYGCNTLGAVAGVFGATFVLFPMLGVRGANLTGAGLDLAVGSFAVLALSRRLGERGASARAITPTVTEASPLPERPTARRWNPMLLSYASVGFTALAYEVAWTRALSMVLGSSIYAFASMLGSFLAGIALGSLLARRRLDGLRRPELVYAFGIAALGLLSLGTILLLPRLPDLFLWLVRELGATRGPLTLLHVAISALVMLPPTLVLGALFPLLVRTLGIASGTAAAVGQVYFANTVGSALGAFVTGFVLIPAIGLDHTLASAIAINLVTAAGLLLWRSDPRPTRRPIYAAILAALAVGTWIAARTWNPDPLVRGAFNPQRIFASGLEVTFLDGVKGEEVLYRRDGLNATVSVHRYRGAYFLSLNGKPDAGSAEDMPTQVLSGHVPMLFGPSASRVLVVGFASGVSVGSVARHSVERVDAVEIEPAILEASRYFEEVNGQPLEDPRVRVIVDDARTYLAAARSEYDVVISEPSNPWLSGSANLFTQEYFHTVRTALRPGGRLLQWIQLYGIDLPSLRSILAALRAEFPYVYGLLSRRNLADLLLLATLEPLDPHQLPRWEDQPERVRSDLSRVDCHSTEDLWSLIRLLPADIDALIGDGAVVNRDDNLFVELRSPWALYERDYSELGGLFERFERGVLPLLESHAEAGDPERVGALALSYLIRRRDETVAAKLADLAEATGASAHARAVRSVLGAQRENLALAEQLALLDEALALGPDAAPVLPLRAVKRFEAGRAAEALADAEAAVALAPDDPHFLMVRAWLLHLTGQPEPAAADMDRLLATEYAELRPDVWLMAASIRLAQGRPEEAIPQLERFLERNPGMSAAWQSLAEAYKQVGRTDDAARARRNQARNLYQLGRIASERGDKQRALSLVEAALSLEPDYQPAQALLESLRAR